MAVTRPLKEGSVTTYQQKVALGFPDILASEMDADLDTIYAAWNGGVNTANLVNGSVTYAKLAPDAQLWRDTGTALAPGTSFATRDVTITGQYASGTGTARTRLYGNDTSALWLANNPFAPELTAKSSWAVGLYIDPATSDVFSVQHRMANAAAGATNLLTLDAGGTLTLPSAVSTGTIVCGASPNITRIIQPGISANYRYTGSWVRDDTSKIGWFMQFDPTNDRVNFLRDNGAQSIPLYFVGAGDLLITRDAYKPTGINWIVGSDPRLKRDIAPYVTGLDAIRQLAPISFKWNGLGGTSDDDRLCSGLDASAVKDVMPDCVGVRLGKLRPDDEADTELLTLDASNITWALVNAVKELAARVAAVEAR